MYVLIYEKRCRKIERGAEKSRPTRAFFSRQKQSRQYKIKKKVSAFFLPLLVYFLFIALHSLLFARLQGLKKALKFSEIKVELNLRPKRAFFSRQKLSQKSTI